MKKAMFDLLLKKYSNMNECFDSFDTDETLMQEAKENGFLNHDCSLSTKAKEWIQENSPKNAIILAAGIATRMVPVNMERPKGLMEVNNEKIIDF